MMEKVTFQPNVPVRLALKFADGKLTEGRFGDQMFYTFTDNRGAYLDLDVAAKINMLALRPGEPFEICKYHSSRKGDRPQWDVRRVDGAPAQPPTPETPVERDLRRSLESRGVRPPENGRPEASVVQTPAPVATAPQEQSLGITDTQNGNRTTGNGSYASGNGNYAAPQPAPAPLKIPFNVAFREILAFCTKELTAVHEQWSDSARQDLISTLLIQAAREGWCTVWERGTGQ